MRPHIDAALSRGGGALSRAALVSVAGRSAVDDEVRRGELIRIAPRVYCRPWSIDDPDVADIAAIRYAAPDALISHTSSLRRFRLDTDTASRHRAVHVCIPSTRRLRGVPATLFTNAIVVHRSLHALRPDLSTSVPCVPAQTAIVQSWPLTSGPDQRAPLIAAIRRRMCSASAIRAEIDRLSNVAGKRELLTTLTLLEAGCESELEIWGYREVFTVPELSAGQWQHWISTPRGRYRVDLAFPDAMLAVELDGRAHHSSPDQWSRDIARDLELAKLGWQTIRFSHGRLTTDVAGCRRDVLAVLSQRSGYSTGDRG